MGRFTNRTVGADEIAAAPVRAWRSWSNVVGGSIVAIVPTTVIAVTAALGRTDGTGGFFWADYFFFALALFGSLIFVEPRIVAYQRFLRVVNPFTNRDIPWSDLAAIEVNGVYPVLVTGAGSRIRAIGVEAFLAQQVVGRDTSVQISAREILEMRDRALDSGVSAPVQATRYFRSPGVLTSLLLCVWPVLLVRLWFVG